MTCLLTVKCGGGSMVSLFSTSFISVSGHDSSLTAVIFCLRSLSVLVTDLHDTVSESFPDERSCADLLVKIEDELLLSFKSSENAPFWCCDVSSFVRRLSSVAGIILFVFELILVCVVVASTRRFCSTFLTPAVSNPLLLSSFLRSTTFISSTTSFFSLGILFSASFTFVTDITPNLSLPIFFLTPKSSTDSSSYILFGLLFSFCTSPIVFNLLLL
mmetsp:Transcript_18884/g.21728  ORF Transcript_18884/g.21728 Transcript_18884/m.21728 type:complete len:216 (-) Transcript_18884:331-978(-)